MYNVVANGSTPLLDYLATEIPSIPSQGDHVNLTDFDMSAFVDTYVQPATTFYSFNSSLTTPPCTEGIQWYMYQQTLPVSPATHGVFRGALGMNAR